MVNQRNAEAIGRRCALRVCVIASCLLLAGTSAGAQQNSITLTWDPAPGERVAGYRVYVGTESGVYSSTYDIPNRPTFVFDDASFGVVYYFAVAARDASGAVSAPSSEISGMAQPALGSGGAALAASGAHTPSSDCRRAQCGAAAAIAQGHGSISALAATRDGRVIYVVNGRRVEIAHASGEAPITAFETASADTVLHGVTLAPDFEQSRSVLIGESTRRADGTYELRLVRYRELGGTLGEGAAVVGGLPADRVAAPLATDHDGNVFVALPRPAGGANRDPYAGHILAFTADGHTRSGDGGAAPVIGAAGLHPSGLFWDPARPGLWMASLDRQTLTRLDLREGNRPTLTTTIPLPFSPTAVAFARNGELLRAVLAAESGSLYEGFIDEAGRLGSLTELALPMPGRAVALAAGQGHGELYVAVQDSDRWTLLRVAGSQLP